MNVKQLKRPLFSIALLIFSIMLNGQTVTGKITSDDGPLFGANVLVKGTLNGAVSDFDGMYTLNKVPKDGILVFSYLGYISQEIPIDGKTEINVLLQEDRAQLEEVVVVGYGTQKKSTITTSISTVKGEDISEIPAADIGQTLQGRAAGVTVTNSGSPGSRTAVRIRGLGTFGDGDPLYVIDGVFTNSLNNINPSSIAKIDVLKDAAATAIYGSRGSNGVIIITTKQGKTGKTTFNFSSYTGFQQSNKRYDLLNTEQYIQYIKEINAQTNDGASIGIINTNPLFDGNGIDTDWQEELFRTALIRNHEFGATGGTEKTKFSFSLSAFDQDGIYIDTNFKRYTFNANSEVKVTEKLKVGQTFALGYTETIAPQISGGRVPLYNVIAAAPYIPVRNADGSYAGPNSGDVNNSRNQVRIQETEDNLSRNTTLIGRLYAEYELVNGLTFKSQFGLDGNYNLQDNISRAFTSSGQFGQANTTIFKVRSNRLSTIFTNTLNYNKSFGKHNLNLTLVSENQNTKTEILGAGLSTTLTSEVPELNNGIANSVTIPEKLISYLGRINYDYEGKYLIQASIRRDKSSIFAPGNQTGWFPAGSLGWVASKEDFLKDSEVINNLKFRASYGITGNNRINLNNDVNAFEGGLAQNFNYSINGQLEPGVSRFGADNPDLSWEEAIKQNYGFELGLWNNKVTIEADYFINGSDKLLVALPLAPSEGVPGNGITGNEVFRNAANIEVEGFELTLGYNDYEGDFQWSFWANATTSTSKVTSLGGLDQIRKASFNPPFSEQLSRLATNEALFHFFGYEFEGVYSDEQAIIDHLGADNLDDQSDQVFQPRPGDVRYRDLNGDGDITEADKLVIGDPNPDFIYSVNIKASYKNFDISTLITGVQGVDALNANTWFLQGQENVTNHGVEVLRRWQNPGDITDVPRFRFQGNNPNNFISTRYIQDASYARLRNLTIGYTMPKDLLNTTFKGIISKARLYLQGQNLVTLTKYKGLDPEIEPFYGSSGLIEALNVDRGSAPQPKTFMIGLQLEF